MVLELDLGSLVLEKQIHRCKKTDSIGMIGLQKHIGIISSNKLDVKYKLGALIVSYCGFK